MLNCRGISVVIVLLTVRPADPLPESGPCNCESTKAVGGWCPECKVGYLAGVRIPSRTLFEVLDAHGHDIDLNALRCATCRKAAADHGFCESCRIGFREKKAYFSRLTYELSGARPVDRSRLKCEACRRSTAHLRWCTSCRLGMVGNLAFEIDVDFHFAKQEFERLLTAVEMLSTCEQCAVAYFARSICPKCRKDDDGGRTAISP
jgi:hypothetical protein